MHVLRCAGDRLAPDAAAEFDTQLRGAVSDALRGDLEDEAWYQATFGVKQAGLGMRTASDTALPAAVASMVGSRSMVHAMCADMVSAGLAQPGVIEGVFDERLRRARARLTEGLADDVAHTLDEYLDKAVEAAARQWQHLGAEQEEVSSSMRLGRRPGTGLVSDLSDMDGDTPTEDVQHVQKGILRIIDTRKASWPASSFQAQEREEVVFNVNVVPAEAGEIAPTEDEVY
jgi:hypothetical protein